MSARVFWFMVAAAAAVIILGLLFFTPPQPENVEIRSIEEYYQYQSVVAAIAGIVVGAIMGWLARGSIYHEPRDRGSDYDRRSGIPDGSGRDTCEQLCAALRCAAPVADASGRWGAGVATTATLGA